MSISEVEVVSLATEVETSEDELTVWLADGRCISVPPAWFPRLLNATTDERAQLHLIGGGEGIHWPRVDEDISIAGLLRGSRPRIAPDEGKSAPLREYRRNAQGSTRRWCRDCSSYPTENYLVRQTRPAGELCNECSVRSANE